MRKEPRFVSVVAVGLGLLTLARSLGHTVFAGTIAVPKAGLELSGPTGLDQLMLMMTIGTSEFVVAGALIFAGIFDRRTALVLLALLPLSLLPAGIGMARWSEGLTGVGVFPGSTVTAVYTLLCLGTVGAALVVRRRG
jgi:hypothetical protein